MAAGINPDWQRYLDEEDARIRAGGHVVQGPSIQPQPPQNPVDRARNWAMDTLRENYGRSPLGERMIGDVSTAAEFAPPVAAARGGYDIGTGLAQSDVGQVAQGALNAIPEVGKAAGPVFAMATAPAIRKVVSPTGKLLDIPGPGPEHPTFAKAAADVERKNIDTAAYRPLDLPEGKEYDALRVQPGGYEMGWNPEKEKYFPSRLKSEGEAQLEKDLKKAEAKIKKGEVEPFFTSKDVYNQPDRPRELPLPKFAKGTPDWVKQQLPGARDRAEAAIIRGGQLGGAHAGDFYKMGKFYDDLKAAHGEDVANMVMDEYGQMMGATTAFSNPQQNQRAATFNLARMYQGQPVPENPPYPFGHMYHAGTHAPGIRQVYGQGVMDASERTKGTLFGGALSGTRDNTVIDQVEAKGMKIQEKGDWEKQNAKIASDPPGQSYTDFMTMRDQLARDMGMRPKEAQAKSWAGFQATPEDVEKYSKPHMFNIGDRVNATALVTGRDPKDVYSDLIKYGIPTLGVGGAGFGLGQQWWQHEEQRPRRGERGPAA